MGTYHQFRLLLIGWVEQTAPKNLSHTSKNSSGASGLTRVDCFKNQSPVAAGLDRYHRQPLACCPVISEANNHVLVVMDADESRARQLALRGGWGDYIDCSLQSLRRLTSELQGSRGVG